MHKRGINQVDAVLDGVMNRGDAFGIVRALPHRPANGPGTKHDTAHRFADTENV